MLGAVGGDVGRNMEVLEAVTPEALNRTKEMLKQGICTVEYLDSEIPLHFIIEAISGNDNQGIASSVPVSVYARENNIPKERLYRALVFSALLTIYQKKFIGKLSAFCGAVSASCAVGAAITYLCGGTMEQFKATVDNTLANIPGIICDDAKISCAAKIASCIDASMMAHFLAMNDKAYQAYTGILKEETDKEIVKMMLDT